MTILINFPVCWIIDVFFIFAFILFGVHIVLHDWIHSLHQAEGDPKHDPYPASAIGYSGYSP